MFDLIKEDDTFTTILSKRIQILFEKEVNVENFSLVKNIFLQIVDSFFNDDNNNIAISNTFKDIVISFKYFLKRFFISYERDKDHENNNVFNFSYIVENTHKIYSFLKNNKENNFKIDFVTYLLKQIFENKEISDLESFKYQKLFYENLHLVNKLFLFCNIYRYFKHLPFKLSINIYPKNFLTFSNIKILNSL